jgi:aerobic-type carbon monoxide dehydrogenase small subunit (CoxS/CutS family)
MRLEADETVRSNICRCGTLTCIREGIKRATGVGGA